MKFQFKTIDSGRSSLDLLGVIIASICMIHCLALPLLVSALPMVAGGILEDEWTHKALAGLVVTVALTAVLPAYLKHGNKMVLFGMISGLSLVLIASFACGKLISEELEVPLISLGNLLIMATHLRNRSICC